MSNFFFTINTNRSDSEVQPLLKNAFDLFVKNIPDFLKYPSGQDRRDLITNISVESSLEQVPLKKRYHVHSYIKIQHKTKLQINLNKCRNFFRDQIGSNGNIHVRFIQLNTEFNLREYIRKNPS